MTCECTSGQPDMVSTGDGGITEWHEPACPMSDGNPEALSSVSQPKPFDTFERCHTICANGERCTGEEGHAMGDPTRCSSATLDTGQPQPVPFPSTVSGAFQIIGTKQKCPDCGKLKKQVDWLLDQLIERSEP